MSVFGIILVALLSGVAVLAACVWLFAFALWQAVKLFFDWCERAL